MARCLAGGPPGPNRFTLIPLPTRAAASASPLPPAAGMGKAHTRRTFTDGQP